MTISSVLTKLFHPSTHAARKLQAHPEKFLGELSALLKEVKNLQDCKAAGMQGNEAWHARNNLRLADRQVWHEGHIKSVLQDIRTIKQDFAFQAKCAKKSANQAGSWHDQRYQDLAGMRDKFRKLQHFKPTASS